MLSFWNSSIFYLLASAAALGFYTLPLGPLKKRIRGGGGVKERCQILNLRDPIVRGEGWVSKSALVSGNPSRTKKRLRLKSSLLCLDKMRKQNTPRLSVLAKIVRRRSMANHEFVGCDHRCRSGFRKNLRSDPMCAAARKASSP